MSKNKKAKKRRKKKIKKKGNLKLYLAVLFLAIAYNFFIFTEIIKIFNNYK